MPFHVQMPDSLAVQSVVVCCIVLWRSHLPPLPSSDMQHEPMDTSHTPPD